MIIVSFLLLESYYIGVKNSAETFGQHYSTAKVVRIQPNKQHWLQENTEKKQKYKASSRPKNVSKQINITDELSKCCMPNLEQSPKILFYQKAKLVSQ